MTYSIWRQGVLLGRTDLAARSPGPNARAGRLETTADFDTVWHEIGPVVDEWLAAGKAMSSVVSELPRATEGADPLDYGRQVHERLKDQCHPEASAEGSSTSRQRAL